MKMDGNKLEHCFLLCSLCLVTLPCLIQLSLVWFQNFTLICFFRATLHLHDVHCCGLLQHFLESLFNELYLDFIPCSVTLQEIVDTELLDKKYNEDEARVSANHLQSA